MNRIVAALLVLAIASSVAIADNSPSFDLSKYEGKVVYLDFWASWCVPCQKSFPWMIELQEKFAEEGLVVLTVNVDRKRELAAKFLEKVGDELPVIYDPEGKLAEKYGLEAMPTSYVLDRKGEVVSSHIGFHPGKTAAIEAEIAELLKKGASDAQDD